MAQEKTIEQKPRAMKPMRGRGMPVPKGAIKIGITLNEILIPKKLFKTKTEKELELDTPLADYCPDISRLIRVDCTPFIENCTLENDKAVITHGCQQEGVRAT